MAASRGARTCCSASLSFRRALSLSKPPRGLWLAQAETHRRRRAAFRTIGSAAARTEHGDPHFIVLAIDRAIGLNGADAYAITLVTFVALFSFCTLRSLGASLPLRPWNALYSLSALRPRRALRSGITLRSRVPAATRQSDHQTDGDDWKNPHPEHPLAAVDCPNIVAREHCCTG